jgi:cell wall-associated NlpC family hydrolase
VAADGVPLWAGRYIGLPFVDGGRDFSGVDCEGLCRLAMKHEAGDPPIPDYGMLSADGLAAVARRVAARSAMAPWGKVERPDARAFDWVIMTGRESVDGRMRTIPCHLGVMISGTRMLHVEKATDSVAVGIDHAAIRCRIHGFVRHEALLEGAPA